LKLSTKAAVYSLFVFPGSGYFFVKANKRGVSAFLMSFICVAVFMIEAYEKAQVIAQKIVAGEISYNIETIQAEIELVQTSFDPNILLAATIVFVGVWLVSAIDSFRLGKKLEVPPV